MKVSLFVIAFNVLFVLLSCELPVGTDDTTDSAATGSPGAADGDVEIQGEGTPEEPFLIQSAAELRVLMEEEDSELLGMVYRQTADIALTGIAVPIGVSNASSSNLQPFTGTYDGGGFSISGFQIIGEWDIPAGFFAATSGATIKDLTFISPSVSVTTGDENTTARYFGTLVGRVVGDTEIDNVTVQSGTVIVEEISSHGSADIRIGGFVGSVSEGRLQITDSGFSGSVGEDNRSQSFPRSARSAGGLVGHVFTNQPSGQNPPLLSGIELEISGSTVEGTIIGEHTGGLVATFGTEDLGWHEGHSLTVTDSSFDGEVHGWQLAGGIIGEARGTSTDGADTLTITDVSVSGEIRGGGSGGGGIAGFLRAGTQSLTEDMRHLQATIENAAVTGTIARAAGEADRISGGIVGVAETGLEALVTLEINTSFFSGEIDSNTSGGILGKVNGGNVAINNSYATGTVRGGTAKGGLAGQVGGQETAPLTITNSYTTTIQGSRFSSTAIGGFIGSLSILVDGLVGPGNMAGNITSSYWLDTDDNAAETWASRSTGTHSYSTPVIYTGLEELALEDSEMQQQASFDGWDFDSVWQINEGDTTPWLQDNPANSPPSL